MLKRLLLTAVAVATLTAATYAASWGDVDGDNIVTANDAAKVLSYVLAGDRMGFTNEQIALCDADGDGVVTANDAAVILQYVLTNKIVTGTETTTEESTETTTEKITEATTEATTETTTEATTEATTVSSYYDFRADELNETLGEALSKSIVNGAYTIVPSIKVNVKEAEVNGETYNQFVQLNGKGSNSSACVYFDVPSDGTVTVIARSSNATEVRSLVVMTDKGDSTTFDMPVSGDTPAVCVASVSGDSRCYIYGGAGNINIYRITYTVNGEVPTYIETTTEATTRATEASTETTTFSGDTSDGTVVSNFNELKAAIKSSASKIYIQGTIQCTENIKLETSGANVEFYGIPNEDGTAATLDFTKFRDSRTSRGSGGTGITLSGSYYTFKYLIVEKAGDCGIRITGSHNTFENCVFRYNNNSGVSITGSGASYNTFRYVDSYRNADLAGRYGADADGFSVKLNAGKENSFYNCRSWENSDDGWDSYDRGTPYVGSVYYDECVTWNNGNPYVFTGEYDYEQGNALDKNLLYVKAILASDPDFESKYNAHTITSWPEVTVNLLGLTAEYQTIHSTSWAGNPNGFKFGSAETPSSSYRYIRNCIAFGHKDTPNQSPAKGFDQNNGSASYDIVNALSFDNGRNYWMEDMKAKSMTGVFYSFNSGVEDLPGDLTLTTPDAEKEAALRQEVADKSGYIVDMVYSNKIPGQVIFNVFD
jgi:hypothetical protein